MKYLASCSFLFIVICFGTYYAVTKGALGRINPVVFASGTMLLLLPVTLVLCLLMRKDITREVLTRGSLLGGCLCGVTLLLTVALQFTSATATAFFPCLNGLIAALFTWLVPRRPVPRLTWCAATLALLGMGLMMAHTSFHTAEWRGTLLAFLGSVTYTGYIFLFDRLLVGYQTDQPMGFWPVLAVQPLTMAAGALVILLLFGDRHAVHPGPRALLALLCNGVFILLLPLLRATRLQRSVDPMSVTLMYTLKPLLGALVAFLYLPEMFPLSISIGQGPVFCGALFQIGLRVVPGQVRRGQDANKSISTQHGHWPLRAWSRFVWRHQRGMLVGLVTVLVLGGISTALASWNHAGVASSRSKFKTQVIVGYASFENSAILDTRMSHGINDGLELDLEDMLPPPAGTAYYGWLLPDPEHVRGMPLLLGKLRFSQGPLYLRYFDPQRTDLFAMNSRVLISVGMAHAPPANPLLAHSSWRYYGQIPQRSASAVNADHSHLLEHLRLLLTSAPAMPGDLRIWFLITTRSLLEGASATQETAGVEDPSFLRTDLSRMLDELDSSALMQQDVPVGTPLSAPEQTVQVPLLQLEPEQIPPGYLVQISQQLAAITRAPDTTPDQRQIASTVSEQLTVVEAALQQVRQDARQLVALSDVQLGQPAAQFLLDDLVEQTSTAYSGTVNPQTGEREGGSLWIADQLERLATIALGPCTPARCMSTSVAFEHPELLSDVLVTPLLEASTGVPLQASILCQRLQRLEVAIPELVLDKGEPILEHSVLFQARWRRFGYLYSGSLMVPDALSLAISFRLLQREELLETIMQESRLPTFREMTAHGRACPGESAEKSVTEHVETGPGTGVLYGTSLLYIIQHSHYATMHITEMIPVAYVEDQYHPSILDPQPFRTEPLS